MVSSIWLIGIVAGAYMIYGGLKAIVWSDLIQGSVLMLGGLSRPRGRLRRLGWDRRDLGRYSCLFRSERAQAAHRVAVERPRNAVARGVRWRALDPQPLLLGHEPVHHPENAGWQESCRGAEGDPLCRLSQAPHSIYHHVAFLHHMLSTFLVQIAFMAAVTARSPLKVPVTLPEAGLVDCTPMRGRYLGGGTVIVATALLYIVFW